MKRTILRIGRDPDCDIPIADDTISRFHAEVEISSSGGLFVVDRSSSNGTFIDRGGRKERISQSTAFPGETVLFGNCAFEVAELMELVRSYRHKEDPVKKQVPSPNPSPPPSGKRIRCAHCGYVKLEGETCPVCNGVSRRIN